MWTPIGISLHKRPSDWKLEQERVAGSAGNMKGMTNPGVSASNKLQVGPKAKNWKGGMSINDNARWQREWRYKKFGLPTKGPYAH